MRARRQARRSSGGDEWLRIRDRQEDKTAMQTNGNHIGAAEKLKFFSEHVRGVLTLSSAAVPAIVGVFGLLFRKDTAGNEALPAFAKSGSGLPAMAAGVTDRLWDVTDLVALWESYERRAERAVA